MINSLQKIDYLPANDHQIDLNAICFMKFEVQEINKVLSILKFPFMIYKELTQNKIKIELNGVWRPIFIKGIDRNL